MEIFCVYLILTWVEQSSTIAAKERSSDVRAVMSIAQRAGLTAVACGDRPWRTATIAWAAFAALGWAGEHAVRARKCLDSTTVLRNV